MQNIFPGGKGGNQHDKGGLRQMEVGDKSVHHFKAVSRIDKNVRPGTSGMKNTVLIGIGFNRSTGSGSRADNSSTGLLRAVD